MKRSEEVNYISKNYFHTRNMFNNKCNQGESPMIRINDGVLQGERLVELNYIAIQQMEVLENSEGEKSFEYKIK